MRNPVASAPCSFGVDEVMEDDAWMPGPEEVLTWMTELGYEGTELGPPGYLGHGAEVRERLERRGLALVGSFLPQHLSRADLAPADRDWLRATLSDLRLATPAGSQPFAVLCEGIDEPLRLAYTGRIHEVPEARLDGDRWDTLVDNLHRAAELCREEGFEPVFHPHAGTYIETADEIDRLMGRLDASLVGLCLDTGHFRYGGADPAQCVRDYAAILRHVHLKDCRASVLAGVVARGADLPAALREGVFCRLGSGDADIPRTVQALRDVGYGGWLVVEQDQCLTASDTPQSLVAGQRANREYLVRLGL
ncbi:sugar phosphate isomerase/epimerase [soil metagenome]